jgi:tRNA/rRNA methyltransferase
VLEETGYVQRYPANARETQLRRVVLRMGLTAEDVPVWMGVMRQMLWKIRQVGKE